MVAAERDYPLEAVGVRVELDRSDAAGALFRTEVDPAGPLTAEQRRVLLAAARLCPVRSTLSKTLAFEEQLVE